MKIKFCIAVLMASICTVAVASAENTDEELLSQGMWRDPDTGLIWMRCSLGQSWSNGNCNGGAKKYLWNIVDSVYENKISFGGYDDWRVPSAPELNTLLPGKVIFGLDAFETKNHTNRFTSSGKSESYKNNVIRNYALTEARGYKSDYLMVPDPSETTFKGIYWSTSQASVDIPDEVWTVYFRSTTNYSSEAGGYSYFDNKRSSVFGGQFVRLVRAGRTLGEFGDFDLERRESKSEFEQRKQAKQLKVVQELEAKRQEQIRAEQQEKARQARYKREAALSAQSMYLQAGKYDRSSQQSDAIRLYELLIEKFPSSPLAVQATNRLVGIKSADDDADRLRTETNKAINEANRQQSQSSAECRRRKEAYKASCGDSGWQCYERAKSICSE